MKFPPTPHLLNLRLFMGFFHIQTLQRKALMSFNTVLEYYCTTFLHDTLIFVRNSSTLPTPTLLYPPPSTTPMFAASAVLYPYPVWKLFRGAASRKGAF